MASVPPPRPDPRKRPVPVNGDDASIAGDAQPEAQPQPSLPPPLAPPLYFPDRITQAQTTHTVTRTTTWVVVEKQGRTRDSDW